MILIITHKEDYTADFLIQHLNSDKRRYFRLNCEDLLESPIYQIGSANNLQFEIDNRPPITSVWYRRTMVPVMEGLNPAERIYFTREFEALLDNLHSTLSHCLWLSNPFSIRQAENKLLQLKIAQELGLQIPKTLVTNDKNALRTFYATNTKTVIKPLYSGYIPQNGDTALFFTNIISPEKIDALSDFDLTPCIYQRYIEKDHELRITVVGEQVFTAKVDSQASEDTLIDWRKAKVQFLPSRVPTHIEKCCINLCLRLNISFGAIDMIVDREGNYWFLEINPNGQWAWIEMDTGLPIANAIVNFLK